MPERYVKAIMKFLSARQYHALKPRQLARLMGVAEEDYGTFREAVKRLRDSGRIVLGAKNALTLPEMASHVVGFFRANPKGFGFVTPEEPNAHGDLFVPADAVGGAMTGDLVMAKVFRQPRRGELLYRGQIVEIVRRGHNRFVGTLQQTRGTWFVLPDGKGMTTPIVVRDISAASPPAGTKVVAEIVDYGKPGELPAGVIVEALGEPTELEVETRAVIRANGLEEEFSTHAMDEARSAVSGFDPSAADGRTDLAGVTVVTIDPPDARDFDDAIGVEAHHDGTITLAVHIADVAHFVRPGGALDTEAHRRGTSVYFPRRVLPMLPEVLSNGVCSLQQGQRRYCQSAFIRYDADGEVLSTRFARTIIRSARRLTYAQAQSICDGKTGGYEGPVVELVKNMLALARLIEVRRRRAGMLHLELPDVDLVFGSDGRVADAVPEDQSYSHTIIEMFMVEANEAVASLLDRLDRAFLRRIHPAPEMADGKQLSAFVRACGYKLPAKMTRFDMQNLLQAVKGRPESYAVNLALLKTFQQAEYSPMRVGHFALASDNYCHFTSPIRRYPDLTVHRLLSEYCRGRLDALAPDDVAGLTALGEHCTAAEKRSQGAESELREVLVLQLLAGKVGETFEGVITGVANFGLFVQSPKFLIEGLVRIEALGDDWWEVDAKLGQVRGERTGRTYRIGDPMAVQIAAVDVARRQLDLIPQRGRKPAKAKKRKSKKG